MNHLGTLLTIWAHPDDETYLVGGMATVLVDAGQRVVCVTATRGEAGVSSDASYLEQLAQVRTAELEAALSILGIEEHHWLDYPDGACADVDAHEAANRIAAIIDAVRPDTLVTFGPDGFTGHPDHQSVSRWTDLALARTATRPRLLHPVARPESVDRELDEDFGVFELGRPRVCADDELDVLLELDGAALDRKVAALLQQVSQTSGLVEAVGLERFRAWVARECFAVPLGG